MDQLVIVPGAGADTVKAPACSVKYVHSGALEHSSPPASGDSAVGSDGPSVTVLAAFTAAGHACRNSITSTSAAGVCRLSVTPSLSRGAPSLHIVARTYTAAVRIAIPSMRSLSAIGYCDSEPSVGIGSNGDTYRPFQWSGLWWTRLEGNTAGRSAVRNDVA